MRGLEVSLGLHISWPGRGSIHTVTVRKKDSTLEDFFATLLNYSYSFTLIAFSSSARPMVPGCRCSQIKVRHLIRHMYFILQYNIRTCMSNLIYCLSAGHTCQGTQSGLFSIHVDLCLCYYCISSLSAGHTCQGTQSGLFSRVMCILYLSYS